MEGILLGAREEKPTTPNCSAAQMTLPDPMGLDPDRPAWEFIWALLWEKKPDLHWHSAGAKSREWRPRVGVHLERWLKVTLGSRSLMHMTGEALSVCAQGTCKKKGDPKRSILF